MIAGTIPRPRQILFRTGREKFGESDLLPMVELVIRQIPAAAISTTEQLGLLALWNRPHRAHIGTLPA
jgi:hypothetical protein